MNAGYVRAKFSLRRGKRGGKGLVLSPAGRAYKSAVRAYATLAARKAGWPDPCSVTACSVEVTTYNTRHDADAACKLMIDALQGIVFANDRVVHSIAAYKAKDDGPVRVEIIIHTGD